MGFIIFSPKGSIEDESNTFKCSINFGLVSVNIPLNLSFALIRSHLNSQVDRQTEVHRTGSVLRICELRAIDTAEARQVSGSLRFVPAWKLGKRERGDLVDERRTGRCAMRSFFRLTAEHYISHARDSQ